MRKRVAAALVILLTYGSGPHALTAAGQNPPRLDRYDHKGTGMPDAAMVRRVAETLGVGQTVDVRTLTSKRVKANIESIDVDSFTVMHGRTAVPLTIAYDEVTQLKRAGWSKTAKIMLAAGVAVGVGILIFFNAVLTGVS